MRLAIYCRVSTNDQTVAPQLDALRAYAHARGLEIVESYCDEGISGARDRRPALDRLLADARRRRFDAIAVVKLDRLARSVRHLTALAAELEALGVDLIVLDQGIDSSTPAGRFTFHILGAVAELELGLIRERTRAGVEAARRRGKHVGRPAALDADQRARLRRMRLAGQSVRHIAGVLGVGKSTVALEARKLGIAVAAG